VVPPAFSHDYINAKQKRAKKEKEDVHLLEIPAAGHFDLIDPRTEIWGQIEQAILRLLV
jgi:hypothetical protein